MPWLAKATNAQIWKFNPLFVNPSISWTFKNLCGSTCLYMYFNTDRYTQVIILRKHRPKFISSIFKTASSHDNMYEDCPATKSRLMLHKCPSTLAVRRRWTFEIDIISASRCIILEISFTTTNTWSCHRKRKGF